MGWRAKCGGIASIGVLANEDVFKIGARRKENRVRRRCRYRPRASNGAAASSTRSSPGCALFVALCLWRFVCGALFGAPAGVGAVLSNWQSNGGGGTALTIIAVRGVAAGWCAALTEIDFGTVCFRSTTTGIFKNASAKKSADRQKSARPFAAIKYQWQVGEVRHDDAAQNPALRCGTSDLKYLPAFRSQ